MWRRNLDSVTRDRRGSSEYQFAETLCLLSFRMASVLMNRSPSSSSCITTPTITPSSSGTSTSRSTPSGPLGPTHGVADELLHLDLERALRDVCTRTGLAPPRSACSAAGGTSPLDGKGLVVDGGSLPPTSQSFERSRGFRR